MPHTLMNSITLYFKDCHDDFSIGECYELGRYVDKDEKTAFEFYQKALQAGDKRAYLKFGQFYERNKNYHRAIEAYEAGARDGDVASRRRLIQLASSWHDGVAEYTLGKRAVEEKDWQRAKEWFQKGAAKKHADAMYELGQLYHENRLSKNKRQIMIQKNVDEELAWYRKAAALCSKYALNELSNRASRDEKAAYHLAQMYEKGEGLIPSFSRAVIYYEQASRLGHVPSQFRLGQLYEKGSKDIPKDEPKAQEYYELAAKKNSREALAALENLAVSSSDPSFAYKIGELYRVTFRDAMSAAKWYKKAADQKSEPAAKPLREIASQNAEIAYTTAQAYEKDVEEKRIASSTFLEFYELALRRDHAPSQKRVEELATAGNAEAQCMIGDYYFSHKKFLDAAKWWMKAAEQKHEKASRLLQQTAFTADVLFQMATFYEEGKWVSGDFSKSLPFYIKADQLGHSQASFRLGQCYEQGSKEVPKDISKAYQYYIKAAKLNHREALISLERLVSSSSNSVWNYELAEIYRLTVKNSSSAAQWYKKAADQKSEPAAKQLREVATQNADIAYTIAQAYEKGSEEKQNTTPVSLEFYGLALRRHHAPSQQHVELLANAGNAQAQYMLADYYHAQQRMSEAIKWCLKAVEQKYEPATRYLNHTHFSADIYFQIAAAYEQGNGITQNMAQAFQFHVKASDAGCAHSSFWLGQWYQVAHANEEQNPDDEKAFDYCLKALRQGCREAVDVLERLGEERSAQKQKELGDLYKGAPVYDVTAASRWYAKVAETDRRNQSSSSTSSRWTGYNESHQKYSGSVTSFSGSSSSSSSRSAFGSSGSFFSVTQRESQQELGPLFQNLDSPT